MYCVSKAFPATRTELLVPSRNRIHSILSYAWSVVGSLDSLIDLTGLPRPHPKTKLLSLCLFEGVVCVVSDWRNACCSSVFNLQKACCIVTCLYRFFVWRTLSSLFKLNIVFCMVGWCILWSPERFFVKRAPLICLFIAGSTKAFLNGSMVGLKVIRGREGI